MTLPVSPMAGTWHDQAPAIGDAAVALLRLADGDPDVARVRAKVAPAMGLIDRRLDLMCLVGRVVYTVGGVRVATYATDDAPPEIVDAAVHVTVELFRRKDAPFGVLNAWSPSGEPLRISTDPLAGVMHILAPHIEGRGIA